MHCLGSCSARITLGCLAIKHDIIMLFPVSPLPPSAGKQAAREVYQNRCAVPTSLRQTVEQKLALM